MNKNKMNAAQIAAMVFGLLAMCVATFAIWVPFAVTAYYDLTIHGKDSGVYSTPYVYALVGMILVGVASIWFERKSKGILHVLTGVAFLAFWLVCKYRMNMDVLYSHFDGYSGAYYGLLMAAFLMLGAGVILAGAERKQMTTGLFILTVFALQLTAVMTFFPFAGLYSIDGPWGLFTLQGWKQCVILAICLFEVGVLIAEDMRKDLLLLLGGVVISALSIGSLFDDYWVFRDAHIGFCGLMLGGLLLVAVGIVLPGRLKKHSENCN